MASCSCGWAFVISKPYELAAPGRLLAHNTHTHTHQPRMQTTPTNQHNRTMPPPLLTNSEAKRPLPRVLSSPRPMIGSPTVGVLLADYTTAPPRAYKSSTVTPVTANAHSCWHPQGEGSTGACLSPYFSKASYAPGADCGESVLAHNNCLGCRVLGCGCQQWCCRNPFHVYRSIMQIFRLSRSNNEYKPRRESCHRLPFCWCWC